MKSNKYSLLNKTENDEKYLESEREQFELTSVRQNIPEETPYQQLREMPSMSHRIQMNSDATKSRTLPCGEGNPKEKLNPVRSCTATTPPCNLHPNITSITAR
jgi:hypothetical protein